MLQGSLSDLGDYDECLSVRLLHDDQTRERFRGQYCSLQTKFILPPKPHKMTLATRIQRIENLTKPGTIFRDMVDGAIIYRTESRLGICVPSVCTKEDVEGVFKGLLGNDVTDVYVSRCEVQEDDGVKMEQVIALCLILAFLTFILLATVADVIRQHYKIESMRFDNVAHGLRHFSVYTNAICLLRTEGSSRMKCVDGARFLSMFWLLLAHTYGTTNAFGLANQKRILSMVKEIPFQIITNPTLSVDTFFVIGGLVIAYSTLKALDKTKGRLNVVRFIIRRIWRLLPPMLFTLGLLYLMPMLGSGPLWNEIVDTEVEKCRKGWWVALLFLTSWVPWKDMCLSHYWYLSVDFQLFLLTPIVLVLLHRRPIWGHFIMSLYFIAGAVVMATLTLLFDLYPAYIFVTPDQDFSAMVGNLTYYKPYAHVGPYFVGVLTGYLLYKYPNVLIKKWLRWCLWTASMALLAMTLFGTYEWNNGHLPSKGTSALSQATLRTGWAMGTAWMLYSCIRQCGGIVGAFLSWKVLLPLGKLSYTMYLYQFLVMWYRNGVRRHEIHLTHFEIVYEFFGCFVATLTLSFLGYLVAEAPFVSLDAVIFPRVKSAVSDSEENLKKDVPKSITHL